MRLCWLFCCCVWLWLLPLSHASAATRPTTEHPAEHQPPAHHRYKVASVDFQNVSTPFIISLWIVIAGLAKIGFHVTPRLSEICPESCLLIVVGVVIGLLLFYTELIEVGPLTPRLFFLFLLPPIVLDAGYYMPNRLFFDNLGSILMFAVVGTVWNALSIGLSLWGLGLAGLFGREIPLLHALLFSSIISAVDPVAVLAVFEEIHVNELLYILVFGESLLNDAVTVVLYHMFEGLADIGTKNIIAVDYAAGFASFFVVALGGTAMGIIWGFLGAFVSRFTHHVRIIEPIFVFVLAYLSYLSAELFKLSGILALTFCGITMKNYVEENISYKSHVTVKYGMKMLANSSETIIFIFLGVATVNDQHDWNTPFVLATIFFCSLYRSIGVLLQSALVNHFRIHRINYVEQFIMSYGGLRGAVAFALVLIIGEDVIPSKRMFITTVISMVYFTVFIQGITIGPLVRCLGVSRSNKLRLSMSERIHIRLMDHLMSGIEVIAGHKIGNYKLRDKFRYYNDRYIRPILTRHKGGRVPKIFETYSKLNISDAITLAKQNSGIMTMLGGMNNEQGMKNVPSNLIYSSKDHLRLPTPLPTISEAVHIDMIKKIQPQDAELHHILLDSSYNPTIQRQRRYSRSNVTEYEPYRHQIPLHTRPYIEETLRPRKKARGFRNGGPKVAPDNPDTWSQPNKTKDESLPADEGIVFFCKDQPSQQERRDSSTSRGSQTLMERTLPWTREGDDIASVQREFPSWVENVRHPSPTATILERQGRATSPRPSSQEPFRPSRAPVDIDTENTKL